VYAGRRLLRILVVGNMYPPEALGGYEMTCRDTVERWCAGGHEVHVLTTDFRVPGAPARASDPLGVERTLEWYMHGTEFDRPRVWRDLRRERRNQRRFAAALRDFRPDVVSFWHMAGMSAGLIAEATGRGLPVVCVVCDDWLTYAAKVDPWTAALLRSRARRLLARLAGLPDRLARFAPRDTICFVSRSTRERAELRSLWQLPEKRFVVPSGIDPLDFPLRPAVDRPWGWHLLCVGRVEPRKGFDVAVRALARLADARLTIMGPVEPEYGPRLHRLIDDLGVRARVAFGQVGRADLAAVYAAADAVLFPSAWEEPFGLVPLEAMACATPVVASPTGGSTEFLVGEQNCLTFPVGDDVALAGAVLRLASDAQLRHRLRENGRETAAYFTIDRYAAALERHHADAAQVAPEHVE
jgi:glycosyltransferase involved in cell wall biosynthesis